MYPGRAVTFTRRPFTRTSEAVPAAAGDGGWRISKDVAVPEVIEHAEEAPLQIA